MPVSPSSLWRGSANKCRQQMLPQWMPAPGIRFLLLRSVPDLHVLSLLGSDHFGLVVLVVEIKIEVMNGDRHRQADGVDKRREPPVGLKDIPAEGLGAFHSFFVRVLDPGSDRRILEGLVPRIIGCEQLALFADPLPIIVREPALASGDEQGRSLITATTASQPASARPSGTPFSN